MTWKPYDLDHLAQEIVLKARNRDQSPKKTSLNQAYKMRAACAYGLERFWGEHLRLSAKNASQEDQWKASFIADVWTGFVGIMAKAGVKLPSQMLSSQNTEPEIQIVAAQIWSIEAKDQQASLAVLTALCDSVIWWTQRLKTSQGDTE
jgi:hypothetical protein